MDPVPEPLPTRIASLRQKLSHQAGFPVLVSLSNSPASSKFPVGEAVLAAHTGDSPTAFFEPGLGVFHLIGTKPVRPFDGEIALVSGGASGIGKAVVESLLHRGAAVINLDINPAVIGLFKDTRYLGLQINLTDETATIAALQSAVSVFGGLDMLVLNAGIFPPGIRIENMKLEDWQKVMSINLDPNLVIMREVHPLLKRAPRYGRVVINSSKNVLAPGAGAVAYSSSKAALTQIGRVAALEWAGDHIRVNQVHPDQVFDTGIWTEEVLQTRSAHYGLTVEQYKKRNLLGVEIKSRYVGEFVAEMLGPLFENMTGLQIPIDGGSDRII